MFKRYCFSGTSCLHVMPSANTSEEDAEPELSKLLLRSSDSLGRSDSGLRSYMRLPKISQKKHMSHAGRKHHSQAFLIVSHSLNPANL